jgi:hypothetical protein
MLRAFTVDEFEISEITSVTCVRILLAITMNRPPGIPMSAALAAICSAQVATGMDVKAVFRVFPSKLQRQRDINPGAGRALLEDDAPRYLALKARDSRFGHLVG